MKKVFYFTIILFFASFISYQGGELPEKAEDISPLLVGETIPDITLSDIEGNKVNLLEEAKKQASIVVFYRGGWCPYCNRQLAGLQEAEEKLKALGYNIIAISPDKAEFLAKTAKKKELSYSLLSDASAEAAKKFGVAFQLDEKTVKKYKGYGINLEKRSGGANMDNILPVPAVFVLDKEGVIKFEYINPNYKERLEPELLLFAAELAVKK